MSKHTPGPCHIHWPGDDGWPTNVTLEKWPPEFLIEFGKENEDYGGCMVIGWNGYWREKDGIKQTYQPEVWADLIAAAPDLLAACKAMLDPNANVFDDSPLWDVVRAAILKAEGGEA